MQAEGFFGNSRPVSDYHKLYKVGEGTYGSVYQAEDKKTGQRVALKRVKLEKSGFETDGMPMTSVREIALLQRLQHPGIVQLLCVAVSTAASTLPCPSSLVDWAGGQQARSSIPGV